MQFQAFVRLGSGNVLQKDVAQLVRAKGLLHKAGAGLGTVLVIAVLAEGGDHAADIVQHILCGQRFCRQNAHAPAAAQAAGNVQLKGAVRLRHKAHIAERGVHTVIHAVAERNLQLARHVDVTADGKQILRCGLGPGHNVKSFAGLHAGQGAGLNVAGVITAAAAGDNAAGDGGLHDGRHLVRGQIVHLDRFAGGQLQEWHMVLLNSLCHKVQALRRDPAARQAQPQHMLGGIVLGITAKPAGNAFVVLAGNFALGKGVDRVGKAANFFAVSVEPLLVHGWNPHYILVIFS